MPLNYVIGDLLTIAANDGIVCHAASLFLLG
jgi:hypothetical protein